MPGRAKQTLTQRFVDRVAATGEPQTFGDAACNGLRLWVGRNGTKRWQRRVGDKTMILGDAGEITLTAARAMCDGPVVAAAPRAARTVEAFLERYAAAKKSGRDWTPGTFKQAPRILRKFLEPLLDGPLSEISRDWTVARQDELMAGGMAASTVTVHTKIVAAFIAWCYQNEHLDTNPYRRPLVRLPVESTSKAVDERDKYLIDEQCREDHDLAMACCVMLALNCGLRRGETQKLLPAHIKLEQGTIYVAALASKTAKPRFVALSRSLVAFLRERLPKLRQDFPLKVGDFSKRWHALEKRARLYDEYNFHHLRHGFTSLAAGRGGDVKTISMALGHASTRTTQGYLHSTMPQLRALARLVEGSPRPYLPAPLPAEDEGE